jgi:hypothetical protein
VVKGDGIPRGVADEVSAERATLIFSAAHEFQPSPRDLSDVFRRSERPHDHLEGSLW